MQEASHLQTRPTLWRSMQRLQRPADALPQAPAVRLRPAVVSLISQWKFAISMATGTCAATLTAC